MSDSPDDRRAVLIAGAISGDLTPAEKVELDALRDLDPTVDTEINELTALIPLTTSSLTNWDSSAPSADLRQRILELPETAETSTAGHSPTKVTGTPPASTRRRPWLMALAAAACVGIGAGGVLLTQPGTPTAPNGPPGTLGAIEPISFTGEPNGVAIDGSLIAHTWGTETVLRITGLTESDPYDVVLVTAEGDTIDSGSFLGSTVTIDCEMNAAVMRDAVTSVEIQDASGTVLAKADVPQTS
ncbi:MAG TPA: hypothetical protein VGP24_03760 [Glaciihabitans sp.]|jgi:hypothetical protein|nr:hypothetical protein [Glaciihabitans sp.]